MNPKCVESWDIYGGGGSEENERAAKFRGVHLECLEKLLIEKRHDFTLGTWDANQLILWWALENYDEGETSEQMNRKVAQQLLFV